MTAWLRDHAPASYKHLRPGASDEQISRLRAALPVAVPDDLVAWLRQNDGADWQLPDLFEAGQSPLSAGEIVSEYRSLEGLGTPSDPAWLRNWIPITRDVTGDVDFVDAGPGPRHGCVYAYAVEDGPQEQEPPRFAGIEDMLSSFATALDRGRTADGWRATVRHAALEWEPTG